jgi:hypothetical protein
MKTIWMFGAEQSWSTVHLKAVFNGEIRSQIGWKDIGGATEGGDFQPFFGLVATFGQVRPRGLIPRIRPILKWSFPALVMLEVRGAPNPFEGKCKLVGCNRVFATFGVPCAWWSQRILQS